MRHPIILSLVITFFSSNLFAAPQMAPVSGFARSFIMDSPIEDATITVLETGQKMKTDSQGHFGPIQYPVGKPITLRLEKFEFKTTQSATVIVPKEGLTSPLNNMTFQVPSIEAYFVLAKVVGGREDDNSCHLATTITAFHKTMADCPQGEEGATLTISPSVNEVPFYFDIFRRGPLAGKTDPFTKSLAKTSEDGGVLIFNLQPRDEPYTISAQKNGVTFSRTQFICRKGVFINISPPLGPMALHRS
jgi:hypothetical protein